jgi:hypothetical protein
VIGDGIVVSFGSMGVYHHYLMYRNMPRPR